MNVSIFKHAKDSKVQRNLSINSFFDGIKNGQWQDEVLNYRAGKLEKQKIPCVTASGVFSQRSVNNLIEHSGLLCIDIDAKDQIIDIDIKIFQEDEHVYAYHNSVGGYGYAVYFKIDPNKHLEAYLGLEEYLFVNYSIVVDKSCKDVSRLRFVSYDPYLYINEKAKTFKKYLKKKDKIQLPKIIVVKSDFDEMVKEASSKNLFDDYNDYIKLAFALAHEFGLDGIHYFHSLCSSSSKYDSKKTQLDYEKVCKRNKENRSSNITIASIYKIFKDAGIKIVSEKTEKIKTVAKLSSNPIEALKDLGIEDDENLITQFQNENENDKDKTELDEIVDLIKLEKLKFNEITRNFEKNGKELTDRDLAEFYEIVWQKIDDKISKDKIWTLIQSRKNTPSFNPIQDFFLKNENVIPDNEFEKLKNCFDIELNFYSTSKNQFINGQREKEEFLNIYLKKWLLGIVGSSFGTYSLMILVLVGDQGIKKTEFFRNLLPKDLKKYYAESNLDEGKDSEILMCKKLLIVDDEFGGKSKKDATKLKRLSSQQTFSIRAPYGRISEDLNRLAVLGGTSNDWEVINDPTGNRRIIPINLIKFDLDKFKNIDKTKLFIELYNEWKIDQNSWFLNLDEIDFLNKATLKNTEIWQEEELLNKYMILDCENYMTTTEIKLALESKFLTLKTNTKRIGQTLKKLNIQQKMIKDNGKVNRMYKIMLNF